MRAEILLAAIAKPHAQHIGHLLTLCGSQRFIAFDCFRALSATCRVAMRVPQRSRAANGGADIFDAFGARRRFEVGALLRRHVACKRTECSATQRALSEAPRSAFCRSESH